MTSGPIDAIYLIISGAGPAPQMAHLIPTLARFKRPVFTILTDNAHRVVTPYQLSDLPHHHLINGYFDPILVTERPSGLVLVAPATFNTINKISQGIADTLAHSLIAEAIGDGWPIIVAPAMNKRLAHHPRLKQSIQTLSDWGLNVLHLVPDGDDVTMASIKTIEFAVESVISR